MENMKGLPAAPVRQGRDVKITTADQSYDELESMVANAERSCGGLSCRTRGRAVRG